MKTTLLTLLFTVLAFNCLKSQNNEPIAVNDTFYVDFNDSLYIQSFFSNKLYSNDFDPNNDSLFIYTAFYLGTGTFIFDKSHPLPTLVKTTYYPALNFAGIDSAKYILKDNGSPVLYDTATIYFYVKKQEFKYLDLNNIKAYFGIYGLFMNYANLTSAFEVPKGDTTSTFFAANLWLAGKHIDSVYANCETYGSHFKLNPNPFPYYVSRSGPIMDSAHYPNGYSYKWDRLWKIHSWEIDYHVNNWNNANYQAIEVIENWPAHGDTSIG